MPDLLKLARLVRYYSIQATAEAGSGHLSSSLSAADLMTALFFDGHLRYDWKRPDFAGNDRIIFSKGHASPLFYSLWVVAGAMSEKRLKQFRKFSREGLYVQGHPTVDLPFVEATTGSLGQGLSIGAGMALAAKSLERSDVRIYVLLGDSEMAEGSVWEAMSLASHYELNNLIAIADVNRLGQRGETMHGHDVRVFERKVRAFGWEPIVIDGHDMKAICAAYRAARRATKPAMIIAKTYKGKGVDFMENADGWHGRAPSKDEAARAVAGLGDVDAKWRGVIAKPRAIKVRQLRHAKPALTRYDEGKNVATRRAYGNALANLASADERVVVLDAETSNSTYAEFTRRATPGRFFEMYIAEQNMAGMALGLSRRGFVPFVSTFAAFLTRAFDQIRMGPYSDSSVKFCGSHAGVSIGEDGVSQMGLEDIAMFRSVLGARVLYPSDAISTERLVAAMARERGTCYIRTTRKDTPQIYGPRDTFPIGGSKTLRSSRKDVATILAAGITLHEALRAHEMLAQKGIAVRVIDLYSIQPLDIATLTRAAKETKRIITVEDHYRAGGIGEAVSSALAEAGITCAHTSLCVRKLARSGRPDELLAYAGIDAGAIVKAVLRAIKK